MKLTIGFVLFFLISCKNVYKQNSDTVIANQETPKKVIHKSAPNNSDKSTKDMEFRSIELLKQAFSKKNEALFLEQFPSDFPKFIEYYGWYDENAQPNELYEESYTYIDYFFHLVSEEKHKEFEHKMISIAKNGRWQGDGVNYFQDKTLKYIKEGNLYILIEELTSDDAKSVLFFLFDGPHPKLDSDFASQLSPSKKEILEELFETGFYDDNENPDPFPDEETNSTYILSDFTENEHFFTRNIDIDNDGIQDRIVSAVQYQGDELLLFLNNGGTYQFILKTTNFSEDGGNQIVDVVAEEDGFVIKTAFPDGGLFEANYHITYKDEQWVLTNTVYKTQSSNQEDAFIYVCDVEQGLDLADANLPEKLKWLPNEADRGSLCTEELN